MSTRAKSRWENGFTLIEMLVALAIVAIALSAISSSYGSLVKNAAALKERTLGRWIADNQMAKQRVENSWPDTRTSEGQLEYAGSRWDWKQVVQATPDPDFRRIEITVSRKDPAYQVASIVSFVRNPKPGKLGVVK